MKNASDDHGCDTQASTRSPCVSWHNTIHNSNIMEQNMMAPESMHGEDCPQSFLQQTVGVEMTSEEKVKLLNQLTAEFGHIAPEIPTPQMDIPTPPTTTTAASTSAAASSASSGVHGKGAKKEELGKVCRSGC